MSIFHYREIYSRDRELYCKKGKLHNELSILQISSFRNNYFVDDIDMLF